MIQAFFEHPEIPALIFVLVVAAFTAGFLVGLKRD